MISKLIAFVWLLSVLSAVFAGIGMFLWLLAWAHMRYGVRGMLITTLGYLGVVAGVITWAT